MKRFGLGLLAALFGFCVLGVAISTATNSVFGKPDSLKGTLAQSNVYDSAAEGIIDQAVKSMQKPDQNDETSQQSESNLNLDPKVTEKIARKVVTPEKLQVYAEQIVDGTYNWLEGDVEQPDYNIDVSAIKNDIGNAVGDTAVDRVEDLPACTLAQLQKLDLGEIDPFTLPCRPPGINLEGERAKLIKEVTTNKELLGDTKVTAEDTKTEGEEKTPFENLAFVPTLFQLGHLLPWILGVLGLAAGTGVVFLNNDRRKGLKKVSVILLVSGVLLLVGIWVAPSLFGSIRFDGTAEDQMREALVSLVQTLNAAFNRTLLVFAVAYAVIGAGGLLSLRFTKPKSPSTSKPGPKTGSDVSKGK